MPDMVVACHPDQRPAAPQPPPGTHACRADSPSTRQHRNITHTRSCRDPVLRPVLRCVTCRTLTSVFDQLRSISFCRFLILGQSPSCTALKILLRSRRTSCSCRCQSMESHPSAVSAGSKPSGPFAIGVQLVLWFRRLTLRRLQRLTCPRQHAFASGPACARYPASSAATPSGGAGQAVAASCHLSATGVGFLGILCSPRNSAPLAVGLPPKRRRGP